MKERLSKVGGNELERFGVRQEQSLGEQQFVKADSSQIPGKRGQLQRLVETRRSGDLADFTKSRMELRRQYYVIYCTKYILCLLQSPKYTYLHLVCILRNLALKKFLSLFISFLRERERERERAGERQREAEREHPKQAPHCQCRTQRRAQIHELQDHDLS